LIVTSISISFMGSKELHQFKIYCALLFFVIKIVKKKGYGKFSWLGRCFKKQDQWDTNSIFTELAGFYTLELDQDKLTVGSGIIESRIRSRTFWSGIIGRKFSNGKYLMFPKKRDNLWSRCQNIPDRKGEQPKRGVFDARLLSIKDGHQGNWKVLNEGLIPKGLNKYSLF